MTPRSWVVSAFALRALAACYSPSISSGSPCDTTASNCPSELVCVATSGTSGTCEEAGHHVDGGGVDAKDGAFCLGAQLAGKVCLDAAPTGDVMLNASLSTDSVAAGSCTEIHEQGSLKYCLITGDTITIPTGATVHAIGANPLVLLAAHTITMQGTLDVSSHTGETFGGAAVPGAGGRTTCTAVGVDGMQASGSNGSAGGAGGSFGTAGAAGGNGRNNTTAGTPAAAVAPTTLVGGCPGGAGGAGSGGGGAGAQGYGGGAVYLLAGSSISVMGTINASGGGGGGGGPGNASSGGGGGGGGGGFVGIESPATTVSGTVFANGGGGGGGGTVNGDPGNSGASGTALATAAAGGTTKDGGGAGGTGATATAAKPGTAASQSNNMNFAAGGGGGGGLGIIKVYGSPTTTGAMFSPPMTSN